MPTHNSFRGVRLTDAERHAAGGRDARAGGQAHGHHHAPQGGAGVDAPVHRVQDPHHRPAGAPPPSARKGVP
eukprot:3102268-Pyramimonas_sp.AAC.1